LAAGQRHSFGSVELPDRMGNGRTPILRGGAPSGGCGLQTSGAEVALQSADAGQRLVGLFGQDGAQVRGTPGGVCPPQVEGFGAGLRLATTVVVGGGESLGSALLQSAEQAAHRAWGEL
jgi:hypothetical protein